MTDITLHDGTLVWWRVCKCVLFTTYQRHWCKK